MSKILKTGACRSRYFPGFDRIQPTGGTAEVFGTTEQSLGNMRARKRGFPYMKQAGKVLYDIDACYEHALAEGSGKTQAA